MKKLFSLFVPLLALFLTLSPQTAKADYVDDNLTEPLTFEFNTGGSSITASFKIYYNGVYASGSATQTVDKTKVPNLQYRLSSNGGSWGAWTNVLVNGTTTKIAKAGTGPSAVTLGGGKSPYKSWKVQLRGVNPNGFSQSSSLYYTISLESSASTRNMTVSGNVMSLIVGYDTSDETAAKATLAAANEIPNNYCFYRLFHYISGISAKMNINATNLIFPATKLKDHCYEDMFYDATGTSTYGLQQAPTFLATDFVDKDGNAVSSSFAGLCNNCQKFTSIHVNFQHCYAAGESNLTNWLKNCGTSRTIYAPAAFRTCANNNSGNSDAVWNGWTKTEWSKDVGPSTHTVTLNVDATDSYGTLTAASIADVPHGATITVSSNTITINGTTVTATKTSDGGGYNYAFAGWYNGASQLTGNSNTVDDDMTITAHFTRAVNTYYVSFDAGEGSGDAMANQLFTYGVAQNLTANSYTGPAVTVTYEYNDATSGASPASETVNASFYMWTDGSGVNFYEDKESVSNLTATNGATVALTAIWDFDQEVTLPSPTKTGYTFVQWEYGEAPFFVVAGEAGEGYAPDEDVTLNAHWNAINYTITYNGLNDASNSNPATYTIETATFNLANPGTRAGYTFTGWTDDDNSNAAVTQIAAGSTGNRHFTANWSTDTYNLTYEGLNGATNTNPATYTIESETITLAAPGTRDGYVFMGWTCGGEAITEITHGSTGDKTITANWNAKLSSITLEDNRENSFYNTFKTTYNGATGLIVTYARQFTAGRWSTLCLPFNVNKAMFSTLNFGSRIYEFKYATGNADDGVNLYFSIAKSIEAGKGYIVNADAKLAARTSFTFSGVTMDLSADNGAELNSVTAYDNLTNGSSTQGNIELLGTLRKGTLKGTAADNRYMGLKDNKIYYPNIATGSTILAYRGIFRSIDGTLNAERIRIIVDGEEKAELEVINGELQDVQETKKFIENGVLYIKRNGVIYDATGRKVE